MIFLANLIREIEVNIREAEGSVFIHLTCVSFKAAISIQQRVRTETHIDGDADLRAE